MWPKLRIRMRYSLFPFPSSFIFFFISISIFFVSFLPHLSAFLTWKFRNPPKKCTYCFTPVVNCEFRRLSSAAICSAFVCVVATQKPLPRQLNEYVFTVTRKSSCYHCQRNWKRIQGAESAFSGLLSVLLTAAIVETKFELITLNFVFKIAEYTCQGRWLCWPHLESTVVWKEGEQND